MKIVGWNLNFDRVHHTEPMSDDVELSDGAWVSIPSGEVDIYYPAWDITGHLVAEGFIDDVSIREIDLAECEIACKEFPKVCKIRFRVHAAGFDDGKTTFTVAGQATCGTKTDRYERRAFPPLEE